MPNSNSKIYIEQWLKIYIAPLVIRWFANFNWLLAFVRSFIFRLDSLLQRWNRIEYPAPLHIDYCFNFKLKDINRSLAKKNYLNCDSITNGPINYWHQSVWIFFGLSIAKIKIQKKKILFSSRVRHTFPILLFSIAKLTPSHGHPWHLNLALNFSRILFFIQFSIFQI